MQHVDFRGNVWDCGIGNIEPHYKDIEYYSFTYIIPKYKIQPPDDFCEYYQTHKDEIIIELDKKTKQQNEEIERLNNELQIQIEDNTRLNEYIDEKGKEIDRLNNIINELKKSWKEEIIRLNNFIQEDSSMIEINNIRKLLIQEREKDLYKLQELKGSDKE